jgi:hypothetical protein
MMTVNIIFINWFNILKPEVTLSILAPVPFSSNSISKFKLCIQTLTSSSNTQMNGNSESFEWFFKHGGDNKSIDVMIHLKDSEGRHVNDYPRDIQLCTELVYEDGTMIVGGFQRVLSYPKKGSVTSSNEVFRRMRPEPVIDQDTGSVHFAFRVEEVSTNHKPHIGFKLKVSPASGDDAEYSDITGSLMKETIIVKSRPSYKSTGLKSTNVGGRSTILQKAMGGIPIYLNATPTGKEIELKDRKKNELTAATQEQEQESLPAKKPFKIDEAEQLVLFHPSDTNLFFANRAEKCLSCRQYLKRGQALNPMEHRLDCRLYMTLCQTLTIYTRTTANRITAGPNPNAHNDSIVDANDLKKPAVATA